MFRLLLLTILATTLQQNLIGFAPSCLANDDWPQWRGPNRTDVSSESGLLGQWPEQGPKQRWMIDNAGDGYSGFSIVDGRLYTMGANETQEFALCLDAKTGEQIWRQPIADRFVNGWGDGPRSTPTISDNQVFVLSANGVLSCLNTTDGQENWKQDLKSFGGATPFWGYSESVLVDNDQVVCTPGGSEGAIIAFDRKTGDRKWQSTLFTDPAQYSSIIVADHPTKRHYVQLTMKSIVGIDPEDGSVLWKHEWPGRTAVIPTPIYRDKKVYVSSGYAAGSTLIDIADFGNVSQVWYDKTMKNHHGGVILVDDHLYGYSDGVGWVCQSWETGAPVWSEKDSLGKGAIGYADGRFYLVSEQKGEAVLIDATPDGWNEKGRFKLTPLSKQRKPRGKIWVHPVISGGQLYLRDQEKIFCFDVKQP